MFIYWQVCLGMSEPITSPMEQGELEQSPDVIHLSPDIELVMPDDEVESAPATTQSSGDVRHVDEDAHHVGGDAHHVGGDARHVLVVNDSDDEAFSDEKEEEKEVKPTKGKHHR